MTFQELHVHNTSTDPAVKLRGFRPSAEPIDAVVLYHGSKHMQRLSRIRAT